MLRRGSISLNQFSMWLPETLVVLMRCVREDCVMNKSYKELSDFNVYQDWRRRLLTETGITSFLHLSSFILHYRPLREKCPNKEFFLVRIFPYSRWTRKFKEYSERVRENTDQKKLGIWPLFTQFWLYWIIIQNSQKVSNLLYFVQNVQELLIAEFSDHSPGLTNSNTTATIKKVGVNIYDETSPICLLVHLHIYKATELTFSAQKLITHVIRFVYTFSILL